MHFFRLSFFIFILSFSAFAKEEFKLNLSNYKSSNLTGTCEFFFSRVYKKVDIEYKAVTLPRRRAIRDLNKGVIDADCAATEGLETKFNNIIPIRIPLSILKYKVLGLKETAPITDVKKLHRHRVGALTLSTYLHSIYPKRNRLIFVEDFHQLMSLLKKKRIDYILFQETEFINQYDKNIFEEKSDVLFNIKAFHYLNKKHLPKKENIKKAIIDTLKEEEVIEYFRKKKLSNP